MPLPFLQTPRELRDLIYHFVLASDSGKITLIPWTIEVAKSLNLLRTCRQIHEECKSLIWHDNGLSIRSPSMLSVHLRGLSRLRHIQRIQHIRISLELLDRGELEWAASALKTLARWKGIKTVTLTADWEKPRGLWEFEEQLELKSKGTRLDGRLYLSKESIYGTTMSINTGWPPFTHWGKQTWLREMLLTSSGIDELAKEMHNMVGGEFWIDGKLCFKDGVVVTKLELNPRYGEIRMVLGSRTWR